MHWENHFDQRCGSHVRQSDTAASVVLQIIDVSMVHQVPDDVGRMVVVNDDAFTVRERFVIEQ